MNAKSQNLLTNILQAFLISSLFVLTAVLFAPVQRLISERMDALHAETILLIEQYTGRSFTYDRISPSFLTRFNIHGVRIGSSDRDEVLLELESLSIRYRILPLILGRPAEALSGVHVQNTELSIDTSRDRELVELFFAGAPPGPADGAGGGFLSAVPAGVTVSGRNLTVGFVDERGSARLSRLRFEAEQGSDGIELDARFDIAGETALLSELGTIDSHIRLEARLDSSLQSISALLDVRSLDSALFRLNRQQFRLQAGGDRLEIRKVEDAAAIDIAFVMNANSATVTTVAEDYQLSQLIRLQGEWREFDPWLSSSLTGNGSFTWDRDADGTFLVNFSARVPEEQVQGGLEFDLRARGDLRRANIPTLRVTTPYGRVLFSGAISFDSWIPVGSLQLDRITVGDIPGLSASFTLSEERNTGIARASHLTYGDVAFHDLEVRLGRDGSRVRADLSTRIEESGSLRAWGAVDLRDADTARFSAVVSDASVQHAVLPLIDAIAGVPDAVKTSPYYDALRLSGYLNWFGFEPGTRSVQASVQIYGQPDDERSATLTIDMQGSAIGGTFDARLPGLELSSDYRLRPVHTTLLEADSRLVIQGTEYDISALLGENYLFVSGGPAIQAEVLFPHDQPVTASIRLRDLPIPETVYTDADTRLTAQMDAEYGSDESWRVSVRELRTDNIRLPWLETVSLSAQGRFDQSGAVLERIGLTDAFGTLEAAGILQWNLAERTAFSVDVVADSVDNPSERYEVQLSVSDRITGSVRMRAADLRRARVDTLAGAADASITISGTADALEYSGSVTSRGVTFDGEALEVSGSFDISPEAFQIRQFTGSYIGVDFENGAAWISAETGALLADIDTAVPLGGEIYPIRLELDGILTPPEETTRAGFSSEFFERDMQLFARVQGTPVFGDLPDIWELDLTRRDGRISIIGGPESSVAVVVEENGEFFMTLSSPLPLVVEADGRFSAGDVELNLNGLQLDVASLPGVLDFGEVAIIAGRASGNLRMIGPITDPDFYGTVPVSGFEMTFAQLPDNIGPADGFLVFSEKEMRIHPLRVPIGQATADASGFFLISRWNIEQYELQIATVGQPGVRFAEDFGGFIVDGYGQGTISLIDNGADLLLTGSLTAHNTTMTLGPVDDDTDSVRADPDNRLLVDLSITAGRSVEFLWPTTQLPILRAVSAPGARVQIRADTVRNTFALTGDVTTQGGELFYLDRTFLIREGTIRFNETQENVDPRLTLRAETRDIGPDGPVRISIIAEESPLSELTVRAVSNPPLSDEDLLAIFGGGIFATGESLVSLSGAVLAGGDIVSQFGVIRSVEARIRSALQLDLFSVRTQLFQNLVRGVIDDPGSDVDEAAIPSLGRVFNNTTVFLGRSLGPDIFAELLVQFRARSPFDDAAERAFAGIELDSEFSLEFETPFFDLQWSFFPRTPDALFVPDNLFTFSWGFTY